jgi:hypothetical protein
VRRVADDRHSSLVVGGQRFGYPASVGTADPALALDRGKAADLGTETASTAPTVGVLRSQLTQLIASMCGDESGVTSSMT